jgi:hypothetical protein
MRIVMKERLWLTADRSRLVKEGDAEAAFLYCIPGHTVSDIEAWRYGIVEGCLPREIEVAPPPSPLRKIYDSPEFQAEWQKVSTDNVQSTVHLKESFPAETKEILPDETKGKRKKKKKWRGIDNLEPPGCSSGDPDTCD